MTTRTTATRRSRAARFGVTVLAVALALTTWATPADAAIVDTDRPLINGGRADFGGYHAAHVFGSPTSAGQVTWGNNQGGNSWVHIGGSLWMDSPDRAGCVDVLMRFRDANRNTLFSRTSIVFCRTSPTWFASKILFDDFQSDTRIRSVVISTRFNGAITRSQVHTRGGA